MLEFAYLVLIAWPLVAMAASARLEPQVAVAWQVVLGLMFLPELRITIPGLPDYAKWTAIVLGVFLTVAMRHRERLAAVRWHRLDLPMLIWLLAGPITSVLNQNGVYDAAANAFDRVVALALLYWVGRAFFADAQAVRTLLLAMIAGACMYVPLIVYELHMSPQLHRNVYGYFQHDFVQTLRGNGYRPMVFMAHGLTLTLFMAFSSLAAIAARRWLDVRSLAGVPMSLIAAGLALTTVMCKSAGATMLLFAGMLIVLTDWRWLIGAMVAAMTGFVGMRMTGFAPLRELLPWIASYSPERALSLAGRWRSEDLLLDRVWEKPFFGWSPWDFNGIMDAQGELNAVIVDSLWIITVGHYGAFGLLGVFGLLCLPVIVCAWRSREVAPDVVVLALLLCLTAADAINNATLTPVHLLLAAACVARLVTGDEPATVVAPLPARTASWLRSGRRAMSFLRPVSTPVWSRR